MLDSQARVLYVGKARSLKARVLNYTRISGHSSRIARMISETADLMVLTTETETEALLLEQNLIKQLKPKYNVLLRDDKSFPYIFISNEHDFPRIEKHRGAKIKQGLYYGPFASAGAVNRTINTLQKIFLLRSCSDREVEAGNLLVSDISEQLGYGSLKLFSFTAIGIPIWLIGTCYMLMALLQKKSLMRNLLIQ